MTKLCVQVIAQVPHAPMGAFAPGHPLVEQANWSAVCVQNLEPDAATGPRY